MAIPDDIGSAIEHGGVALSKGGVAQAKVLSYTDQPTVLIEFADGIRQTLVLSVFRRDWVVPEPPTEDELARAAQVLERAAAGDHVGVDVLNRIAVSIAHELRAAAGS